jgi:hypothetical protein
MATCFPGADRLPLLFLHHIKQKCHLQKTKLINQLRSWTHPIYPRGIMSGGVVDMTRSRAELILENMLQR